MPQRRQTCAGDAIGIIDITRNLEALRGAGELEDYYVGSLAFPDSYNARARALAAKVYAHVRARGRRASVEGQVNWYNMTLEMLNDEKMVRLIKTNLELIGCRAVEKLISLTSVL